VSRERVGYEWDLETWEGEGEDAECVEHNHADKLADVPFPASRFEKLVLVRSTDGGSRSWAYVDQSMMLPRFFSQPGPDGNDYETDVRVPQRFHREIARALAPRKGG
jgi:hypothetical protein